MSNKKAVLRKFSDESVLVPVGEAAKNNPGMFFVNEVGAMIFTACQDGKSKEEIIRMIMSEFDVDEETVSKDVENYMAYLNEKGIV